MYKYEAYVFYRDKEWLVKIIGYLLLILTPIVFPFGYIVIEWKNIKKNFFQYIDEVFSLIKGFEDDSV